MQQLRAPARGRCARFAQRAAPSSRVFRSVACASAAQSKNGRSYDIHKFGGTCVSTAERITNAATLVKQSADKDQKEICVVVSALGTSPDHPVKVTDLLLSLVSQAASSDKSINEILEKVVKRHTDEAINLLGKSDEYDAWLKRVEADVSNIAAVSKAIGIAGLMNNSYEDFIAGHGELWSARLFAAKCKQMGFPVEVMDTRDVVVVSSDSNDVNVDYEESAKLLAGWMAAHNNPRVIIATGFIARDKNGRPTTLKRNGSDLSATIMGALLHSKLITIWTDVDGVFSADPRKVPGAVCLDSMSYKEAWELAYFGANVLHPRTTLPAMERNIPIVIRNIFNLPAPGTVIAQGEFNSSAVRGFAAMENVTLISIEGTGMAGVPGIARTIFGIISDANINIIMISQASSEQSICFAVKSTDAASAEERLRAKLKPAMESGFLSSVTLEHNCAIIAAIGSGMVNRKGVAATFFGALADAGVNIKCIAQGSSEYNITVLLSQVDCSRAIQAAHSRMVVGTSSPADEKAAVLAQLMQMLQEAGMTDAALAAANKKGLLAVAKALESHTAVAK